MKVIFAVLISLSNLAWAAEPDRDVQNIEINNSLLAVQDYIGNLYVSQVPGFPEAEIYPGGNLKVCGEGIITSEALVEGEYPYDGAFSYLSFPVCLNDNFSYSPFANLITRCDMERIRCGRYCHSIRANCSVLSAELVK